METVLVFVHLGVSLPEYLLENIRRTKMIFPTMQILLIGDRRESLSSAEILGIETYLHVSESQDSGAGSFGYSQGFRGGFWSVTKNRLFAIADWHSKHENVRVLHLESDVMSFADFPWENFETLNTLAWLKVNADHDCAAILFSPNGGASKWLGERLRDEINEDSSVTDMTALSRIRNKNPTSVYLLPTWSRTWPNGSTEAYRELCDDSVFPGIFDAATVGMWLLGRDPRNHRGFTQFLMETSEHQIDTKAMLFELQGFDRLRVDVSGVSKTLYNLHVHSKNVKALGESESREVSKRIAKARALEPYREFSLRAAKTSVFETLRSIFNRDLIPKGIRRFNQFVANREN